MSRTARIWMVAALLAVVALAFRVSWNALRDVATAIGADSVAATVYPLVVDGLMALALVAALVLTGRDRRLALRVLGGYTAASLVLNYVHGLVPTLHDGGHGRLADWAPAHWALVLLASSLPVGSIYYGSELVAKVLHHRPQADETDQTMMKRSGSDQGESPDRSANGSVYESPGPGPDPHPTVAPTEPGPVEQTGRPTAPAALRPRRATRAVPQSARTTRPKRTAEQLLSEARSATAEWTEGELTADRIRTAVRTSAANARTLRDALAAERAAMPESAEAERPALHAVPNPNPQSAEQPESVPDETTEEKAS